jgi:mono/diheme cytochrome c family protein
MASRFARAVLVALAVSGCMGAALSRVETSAAAPKALSSAQSAELEFRPTWTFVQSAQPTSPPRSAAADARAMLDTYCVGCHNQRLKTGGLSLDTADVSMPHSNPEVWERVIARLRAGSMPPAGRPRPDAATAQSAAGWLETSIDRAWIASPNPGRVNAVHRLNRTEYSNAVRDLLALDPMAFDVRSLLPGDETADGSFDNFADVLTISTAHLERYLSAARQVTRLATGLPPSSPALKTFEIPLHVVQDDLQDEDLPFGSRGGIAVRYLFPVDGEYLIKVRLRRQYQDYLMGMGWPQQLDVRLDGKLLKRFVVGGKAPGTPAAASYAGDGEPGFAGAPEWETYMQLTGDAGLEVRVPVTAGPRVVGVSFVRELWEPEGLPQPLQRGRVLTNDQIYMGYAAVGAVQIGGPYDKPSASAPRASVDKKGLSPQMTAADTPSRRRIFVCNPDKPSAFAQSASSDKEGLSPQLTGGDKPVGLSCATTILSRMARLAYRRAVTKDDLQTLLAFFERGRRDGGTFDAGIQFALERMLVDPDFLLRVYKTPRATAGTSATAAYRLSDVELASRLSFFLWSSIPDEALLDAAERGELSKPAILEQHVRRMLADPRATSALVGDFAAQWLNLRRVGEVVVHPDFYPDFDDNLLAAFMKETELFIASTVGEDRSVLDLLRADYTFVNERLARHYGIPGVYGSRFRRITLPNLDQRGGLLGQGAILATTSYPDRTSPVLRGKWLLDNIFGVYVPPPPANVDTSLTEVKPGTVPPTIRERLAQHRRDPVCGSCHAVIDPPGFALEHFDAIGKWRTIDEAGKPVDAVGTTVSGAPVEGLAGLRSLLLQQPDRFPTTVTEKLLAYALGRRLEYYDRPAVRQIVRTAGAGNYRWSSLILGIVNSPTFQMRGSP